VAAPVQLYVPAIKTGLAEVSGRKIREEQDHGWWAEIGQVMEIEELPGDHFTMMVDDGAARLASSLAQRFGTIWQPAACAGERASK
jgi:hypothetical protein